MQQVTQHAADNITGISTATPDATPAVSSSLALSNTRIEPTAATPKYWATSLSGRFKIHVYIFIKSYVSQFHKNILVLICVCI